MKMGEELGHDDQDIHGSKEIVRNMVAAAIGREFSSCQDLTNEEAVIADATVGARLDSVGLAWKKLWMGEKISLEDLEALTDLEAIRALVAITLEEQ